MSNITKKDIETFGKVLAEIGIALEENPSILLDVLISTNKSAKPKEDKEEVGDKAKTLNIFDEFKDKKKSEIESELSSFNKEELKFIIKSFSLGNTKLNSVPKLAEFIADQVSKRTKDVFINQE
ncbi:hypothetical protein EXT46_13415 [Pseudoalteromonas sp. CO325X]|uniref:hypothetical protein n=1 Tax=Pseudoalteromonas sp. CO325X TaxID=1777262 RepID=UPI0010232511|nr:hypothetical protein [Pseudoalteromonas sp. CO325X]RZF80287.1 hypothetical protein EXT46_13415 [Pseudoalteromonas sp. CO325X]